MPTKKKNPYVIVRCRDAGVHAGEMVSRKGREVRIKNSRRLWRWWSRFSLSELAMEGPSRPGECKFATAIPHEIELLEACEILPCTKRGEDGIKAVPDAIK
jgi:hypothetical protein